MQIICTSRSIPFIKKNIRNSHIGSFILSLEGYNLYNEYTYSQDELVEVIQLVKSHNKKIIIDIAKIIHEDEIEKVKEKIVKLNSFGVDYFMYSDFGIYNLLDKLGLKNKAMLYSNTYLTNTFDTKIYQQMNGMVVLSNQINVLELLEISNNAFSNQVINAFGTALIMYTRRPLLTNYFKYRGSLKESKKQNYSLQEEYRNKLYPIVENNNSTKIYDYGYYYLLDELSSLKKDVDIIVSGELLSNKDYQKVLDLYSNYLESGISNINIFEEIGIELNKGAYARRLTLLKGGSLNE